MTEQPPATRISKKNYFSMSTKTRLRYASDILPSARNVSNLLVLWKFTNGFDIHFVVLDSYQFMNHSLYNITLQMSITYMHIFMKSLSCKPVSKH